MFSPSVFSIYFLIFGFVLGIEDSPVTCSSNNTSCDPHGESLIVTYPEVETIFECRVLCIDTEGCEFFTYYGAEGFPLKNFCQLFASCDETLDCIGCVSETRECHSSCSSNVIGQIDNNFLDFLPNLDSEFGCMGHCKNTTGCKFYTYYLESDPYFGTCILLSSIIGPLEKCDSCVTGPINCNSCDNFNYCGFCESNKKMTTMMVTQQNVEIDLSSTLSVSQCRVRILAVGAGGSGDDGGGGSGFIQYYSQKINESLTSISLHVQEKDSSLFTIYGQTVEAARGQLGSSNGGDGYSGGGGYTYSSGPGCNGGSDGIDGECESGGKGTEEDVTSYIFENFKVTPGAGGGYHVVDGNYCGGGGGGVLINGHGPSTGNKEQWTHATGYGAGGTQGINDDNGYQGVIIIEMVEDQNEETTIAAPSTITYTTEETLKSCNELSDGLEGV